MKDLPLAEHSDDDDDIYIYIYVHMHTESNRKLLHLFILSKTAALVSEFAVEDLPSAEQQLRFLRLQ